MYTSYRRNKLRELESKLGITFVSENLLNQALTHSSFVHESGKHSFSDNERLEFMGDAVLKLVISEYLFNRFPGKDEGDLTKIRGAVISDVYLANIALNLNLGKYLLFGKNEKSSGGENKKSNLANALEAIIAAVYLDGGLMKARDLIINLLQGSIEEASAQDFIIDYKSTLQEFTQRNRKHLPSYNVVKELGPKHKKVFWIEVKIDNIRYGLGKGYTKKEAEQKAAKGALKNFKK